MTYDPYLGNKASEAAEDCLRLMICTYNRQTIWGQILTGLRALKSVKSCADMAGIHADFEAFEARYGIKLADVPTERMDWNLNSRLSRMSWEQKQAIRISIFNLCMEVCFSVTRRLDP